MDYKKLYVGEYSINQKCGHIETLEKAIENNRYTILNNTGADYYIIAVDTDYDKVVEALDNFKKEIESEE